MESEYKIMLDWRVLTAIVRKAKTPAKFIQRLLYGNENYNGSDIIDVEVEISGRKLAPFVTDTEGGKVVSGKRVQKGQIKIPKIRIKEPVTAKEIGGERELGESYYVNESKNSGVDAEKKCIVKKTIEIKEMAEDRTEWLCAKSLTGKVIVQQENIEFEVDYGIPDTHKIVLAGEDAWTHENSDPENDLQDWNDILSDTSGGGAKVAICGTLAAKALRKKIAKSEWVKENSLKLGKMEWNFDSYYMGELGGVHFFRYGDTYLTDDDKREYFIDTKKIYLVNTDKRFTLEFGAMYDLDIKSKVIGKMLAKSWKQPDPSGLFVLLETKPLPVPYHPEAILEAQVVE